LVFVTKYRPGVLRSEHLDLLHDVFANVCSEFGATLVECNGEDDHVHLLVEYPPTVAISGPVNSLKGLQPTSAPAIRDPPHRDDLWSPSYLTPRPAAHPIQPSGNTSKLSADRPEPHCLTRP
jgi:putative transposase